MKIGGNSTQGKELLSRLIIYFVFTSTMFSKVATNPRYSSKSEMCLVSVEKVVQGRGQSEAAEPRKKRSRRAEFNFIISRINSVAQILPDFGNA